MAVDSSGVMPAGDSGTRPSAPAGSPGPQAVCVAALTPRDAAVTLVRATFNQRLVTRDRLMRLFESAVGLAGLVPVRTLSYPRVLSRLPEVVTGILNDVDVRSHEDVVA